MPRYALIRNNRVHAVISTDQVNELKRSEYVELTDEAALTLTSNPHLMAVVSVDKHGNVVFPNALIAQEKQSEEAKGRMRRTTDLKAADVVFDGTSCFLQAAVDSAKLSIVDATGAPVMTFQVDSPFPVQFPEGAELFCLTNNVTTFYVAGWA